MHCGRHIRCHTQHVRTPVFPGFTLVLLGIAAACSQNTESKGFPALPPPQDPPTLEAIEATVQDETLDDFEDQDLLAWLPDGEGHWTSDADGAGLSVVEGGAAGDRSLQVTPRAGRAIANLSFPNAPLRRHDYSSCTGIELTVRHDGSGTATTQITIDSVDASNGAGTRGLAAAPIEVTGEWQTVAVEWSEFAPATGDPVPPGGGEGGATGTAGAPGAGGGVPAPPGVPGSLDTGHILALSIDALPDARLLVDSIQLVDCELLPLNPPLPDPPPLGTGAPEGSPVARHGQLRVQGNRLHDQNGDPVQLKGVSSMWLNYENDGYAESLDGLRWMRDHWNVQLIRAAMGAGDNDSNGRMSNSYSQQPDLRRAQVERIIENAVELGVYVIVDWHSHETRPAEARAFFDDIAQRYGDHPNVIYETFNEPTHQEWLPELKPYHESVVAAIRAHDPDNPIVLGTRIWSQDVNEAANDPVGGSNLLYTLHFYTCTHKPDWIMGGSTRAMNSGVAIFATEWGATAADGGLNMGPVCTDEAVEYLQWMEDEGISWAAWKLDNCSDSSCLFRAGTVPVDGGWTEANLNGHAPLVIEWLQR